MDADAEAAVTNPEKDLYDALKSAGVDKHKLELVNVEVLLTEEAPQLQSATQHVMTDGEHPKNALQDKTKRKSAGNSPLQEHLMEALEPCIEFHTIKVEPLDFAYRSDSDSWDGPDHPSALPHRHAPAVPEPGFSMTVPLKTLKATTKRSRNRRTEEYHCEFCKKRYVIKSRLIKHIGDHLGIKPDRVIRCEVCNKKFDFPHQLIKHSAKHSMERRFPCFECDKSFRYYANLQVHLKRHTQIREVCDECGKVFHSHGGVFRHKKRMHPSLPDAEHRPFSCEQCGAKFRNKRNLTVHERTHTGIRPYACRFCGKSFVDTSTLNRHVRIHTGHKPYRCELCAMCFTDGGSLTFHVRKHHTGERPHRCPHCDTAYHHHSNLKRHLRTHLPSEGTAKKPKMKKGRDCDKVESKTKQKRGRKIIIKKEIND